MKKIIKLTFETEKNQRAEARFPLEIFSVKGAIFLNYFLNYRIEHAKRQHRYFQPKIIGGGLFIKTEPSVYVNEFGEIGLYLNDMYELSTYIRTNPIKSDYNRIIREKIANELKELFNLVNINKKVYIPIKYATFENDETLPISENELVIDTTNQTCIQISEGEYRCMYEFLKGRSKDKTMTKYGNETYISALGKKIEDQFVISAMEVIKAEIEKANTEYAQFVKDLRDDFDAKYTAIRNEFNEKSKQAAEQNKNKLAELHQQLEAIKNMTPTM